MNKTILDLTRFDNGKLFNLYFNTIEELDNYILKTYGLQFDKFSANYGARVYKGDYHYFANEKSIDAIEIFAILRTYVNKYENGYGFSSYDFGYHCPCGWRQVNEEKYNIHIIDSKQSHYVQFRGLKK